MTNDAKYKELWAKNKELSDPQKKKVIKKWVTDKRITKKQSEKLSLNHLMQIGSYNQAFNKTPSASKPNYDKTKKPSFQWKQRNKNKNKNKNN